SLYQLQQYLKATHGEKARINFSQRNLFEFGLKVNIEGREDAGYEIGVSGGRAYVVFSNKGDGVYMSSGKDALEYDLRTSRRSKESNPSHKSPYVDVMLKSCLGVSDNGMTIRHNEIYGIKHNTFSPILDMMRSHKVARVALDVARDVLRTTRNLIKSDTLQPSTLLQSERQHRLEVWDYINYIAPIILEQSSK
ncbi:MAG: hypothetical protein AAFY76_18305, partial [Cyanobacteria bacterium J06649_11]